MIPRRLLRTVLCLCVLSAVFIGSSFFDSDPVNLEGNSRIESRENHHRQSHDPLLGKSLRGERKQRIELHKPELGEMEALDSGKKEPIRTLPPVETTNHLPEKAREGEGERREAQLRATEEPGKPATKVNNLVHAFYYAWYANPSHDEIYLHWNHDILPHWRQEIAKNFPSGKYQPPDNIGANYYPSLGPYSSRDPEVIENHMQQLVVAGVGVIAVSWYNPKRSATTAIFHFSFLSVIANFFLHSFFCRGDGQGRSPDPLVPVLLDACQRHGLKLTFHMEPFEGRTPLNVRDDVSYIMATYSNHPALYLHSSPRGMLPMFYIYDSYQSPSSEWKELLSVSGSISVRKTPLDALYIGLLVESKHFEELVSADFDGFYTYFASDGFTYGSSTKNWPIIEEKARSRGIIFIPSVGPGYIDTQIRPWNDANTYSRQNGNSYKKRCLSFSSLYFFSDD